MSLILNPATARLARLGHRVELAPANRVAKRAVRQWSGNAFRVERDGIMLEGPLPTAGTDAALFAALLRSRFEEVRVLDETARALVSFEAQMGATRLNLLCTRPRPAYTSLGGTS